MEALKIIKNKNNKIYEYIFIPYPNIDYNYILEKLSELDIDIIRFSYKYCRFYTNNEIENELSNYFGNKIKTTFKDDNIKHAYELRFDTQ